MGARDDTRGFSYRQLLQTSMPSFPNLKSPEGAGSFDFPFHSKSPNLSNRQCPFSIRQSPKPEMALQFTICSPFRSEHHVALNP